MKSSNVHMLEGPTERKSSMVVEAEVFHVGVSLGAYGLSWRCSKIYSTDTVTSSCFAR